MSTSHSPQAVPCCSVGALRRRRSVIALCANFAMMSAVPLVAMSQTGPPLRILVPFPAGGTLDSLARTLAEELKSRIDAPVVVDNKPGASGIIALDSLVASAADGKTILLAPFAVPVLNPLTMSRRLPIFGKDYLPVGLAGRYSFAIAVAPAHPARSVKELMAWLKGNPAKSAFGTSALGNLPHFIGLSLGEAQGIDWLPVGYKGSPPLKVDLMGGHIASGISSDADFLNEHRQGKLRILATTGATRSTIIPDVPTLRESGFELEAQGWFGIFVPAGTSPNAIQVLNGHLVAIMQLPDVREKALQLGLDPATSTPQQLRELVQSDSRKWGPVVKASNFKID